MNDTKNLFDKRGAYWDMHDSYGRQKIGAMLMLADIAPHSVILDVGCGTGVLEPYLLAYHPSVILGVDFAPSMIATAKKKINHEAVRFVCADIFDITDLQCDYCFLLNVYQHLPEPKTALEHISALIKSGGRIIISHTQGRKLLPSDALEDLSPPAAPLKRLLEDSYRLDTVIDSNAMLLVSGIKR